MVCSCTLALLKHGTSVAWGPQGSISSAIMTFVVCSLSGEVRLHTSGMSAVGVLQLAALPGVNRRPKRSLHYADGCGGTLLACGSDGGAVYVFDVEQKALIDDYDKRHEVQKHPRWRCSETEFVLQSVQADLSFETWMHVQNTCRVLAWPLLVVLLAC